MEDRKERPTNRQLIAHINVALDHLALVRKELELRHHYKNTALNGVQLTLNNLKDKIQHDIYRDTTHVKIGESTS